ncbi:hypothetical protein BDF22DRAFT_673307 [Syncephalis plumigaleata]|nr:hypothetical protein BDF22DRAFT_673307 [Syncephalis plumigaleata]
MYTTRSCLVLFYLYLTCTPLTLARYYIRESVDRFNNRLLHCLINEERASHDLPPLLSNSILDVAAEHHSKDQAKHQFLSHVGSNGSLPPERAAAAAVDAGDDTPNSVSENVLYGAVDEQHAVRLWMESPGHRKNILDPDVKVSGIGFARHDGINYVTQMFARTGNGVPLSCMSNHDNDNNSNNSNDDEE